MWFGIVLGVLVFSYVLILAFFVSTFKATAIAAS